MVLTISPCSNRRSLNLFERTPELLHREDPYFVPPFPGSIVKMIGPKSPFLKHGEILPFIAQQGGRVVGRIAAVVNRSHNTHYSDRTGFFGFFDCIDDERVANELFATARKALQERGLDSMRGPYNPSINDELGLLVDGFSSAPFVMMPYNPAYYLGLYEKAGLKAARDFYAFYISAESQAPERVQKIVDRVKRSTGVTLRSLDMSRLDDELKVIKELYNSTLCRNWGYVPITFDDLQAAAADLKQIVDPEMVLIAEKNGQTVGYSMTIPNINEFLWRAKKSSVLVRILRFVWKMKTSHPREARLAAMGIHPDYRNTGIAALFYYETLMRGKQRYIGGELSWVEETNTEMIKSIRVMGGEKYKTYRIFESAFSH